MVIYSQFSKLCWNVVVKIFENKNFIPDDKTWISWSNLGPTIKLLVPLESSWKVCLEKVTLLFQNFSIQRALEAPKVGWSDFKKIYENQYSQKTPSKKFNFQKFFNNSIPLKKHINFSQIPFFDFGPKNPLKVENWIFQVFWGFQV